MYNFWKPRMAHYISLHATSLIYDENHQTFFGAKGAWQVYDHDLCTIAMGDYKAFSNAYLPKMDGNPLANNINQIDPPRHKVLRKILTQAFTTERIDQLTPWIYQIANHLLDDVAPGQSFDYVSTFAQPFPSLIINHMLGIDKENSRQVTRWVDTLLAPPGEDMLSAMQEKQLVMGQMMQYFQELIAERKTRPTDDLLSALLIQEDDGIRLNEEEVFGTAIALIMAGNSTTSGLISNSVQFLLSRPDLQQQLRQDNNSDGIVNELLRYRCPVQSHYRIANMDVQLGQCQIKKGDLLKVWIAVANYDEKVFPHPDQFDQYRNNFHKLISFGHGIHYCVGEALGRLETKIALQTLFTRFKGLEPADNTEPLMNDDTLVLSPRSLLIKTATS